VVAALASNAVKVTLLLALTGVAALALRKRSAAERGAPQRVPRSAARFCFPC
jgi:hypothetical protein